MNQSVQTRERKGDERSPKKGQLSRLYDRSTQLKMLYCDAISSCEKKTRDISLYGTQ